MNRYATCLRKIANITKVPDSFRWEDPDSFNPDKVREKLPKVSPKLVALLRKIRELDDTDLRETGKLYKHMIFSDIKPTIHGSKAVVAALLSASFHLHPIVASSKNTPIAPAQHTQIGILCSTELYRKPQPQEQRKELLTIFNARPDNIHGENMRLIVLDGGFKEGVDLFDVKYVHLLEPLSSPFSQRQAIGRATRHCGQKGLPFQVKQGWPLHVFRYDLLVENTPISEIAKKHSSDEFQFMTELCNTFEDTCRDISADKFLTEALHKQMKVFRGGARKNFQNQVHIGMPEEGKAGPLPSPLQAPPASVLEIVAPKPKPIPKKNLLVGSRFVPKKRLPVVDLQAFVQKQYTTLKGENQAVWEINEIENLCVKPTDINVKARAKSFAFTPTQNFVRLYFTPENPIKGMLLFHTVGTGKTATAIGTASASYLKKSYTVLWVTRHTLKTEYYKNIFDPQQTCFLPFRQKPALLQKALESGQSKESILSSYNWVPPISYKQFTNLIRGKNKKLHDLLVNRNGSEDIFKKTLVIIDEAHRLVDNTLPVQERPDLKALRAALQNSYNTSKALSAKVLLMTATPFTNDPMDLCKLMNLIMDPSEPELPTDLHAFASEFLKPGAALFTEEGYRRFGDRVSGQISYLNRTYDIRQFARPIIHKVYVQPSHFSSPEYEQKLHELHEQLQNLEAMYQKSVDALQEQLDVLNNSAKVKIKAYVAQYDKEAGYDLLTEQGKKKAREYKKRILDEMAEDRTKIQESYQSLRKKYENRKQELEKKVDKWVQRRHKFLEKDDSVEGALYRCAEHIREPSHKQEQTIMNHAEEKQTNQERPREEARSRTSAQADFRPGPERGDGRDPRTYEKAPSV